jgi:hypothetical protein
MAADTLKWFNQFIENVGKGVHDFSSDATCTVTVALCAAANPPVATFALLTDLTQISYTNLSSRVVTGITLEQVSGSAPLTATDLVLTASGGSVAAFRYVVFYDDDPTSPADPLIGWLDLGADLTLTDTDTLTINFGANGLGIIAKV